MFTPESYTIVASLLPRLLGCIFFFAFGAFLFQIKGLVGENGIIPLKEYLNWLRNRLPRRCYFLAPTLCWINSSDRALMCLVGTGTALSLLLILGVYPPLLLFLLYILYLSLTVAGQDFLWYGWEGFLLEATINTFFLSLASPPNLMIWISINLLVFRFHVQAGAVKLQSRDPNWRNLTAIAYHYQTQPIPNVIAWYVHKLPMWFHKFSTLMMFVVELIVPFAIFGPDWIRLGAFIALVGLQWSIWVTGNLSYLNHLTVVMCTILVANAYLPTWMASLATPVPTSWEISGLCTVVGTFLVIVQCLHLLNHFYPKPILSAFLSKLSEYHIANRYGIFAVMTTTRNEIIFEGSDDGIVWKEYLFYQKPSEITRRPRRISPYQPRLDWQAWFLPFGNYRYERWITNFIFRLLKGTPEVLALLRFNPFPDKPPKFVRSLMYEYVFSTMEEKKKHGWWWRRHFVREFTKPMRLNQ